MCLQAVQFLGPPVVIIAILYRDPDFLDLPKVMAALLTTSSTLLVLSGGIRDDLDLRVFCLWNAGGALCYGIGIPWAAWLTPDRTRKPVYLASTVAMLAGSCMGAVAWSETVPEAVARAARATAAGMPYCVMPGPDRDNLRGVNFVMFAAQNEFSPIGIDAIVDKGGQHVFLTWSFPEGRFTLRGNPSHAPFEYCTPVLGGNLPWH